MRTPKTRLSCLLAGLLSGWDVRAMDFWQVVVATT